MATIGTRLVLNVLFHILSLQMFIFLLSLVILFTNLELELVWELLKRTRYTNMRSLHLIRAEV